MQYPDGYEINSIFYPLIYRVYTWSDITEGFLGNRAGELGYDGPMYDGFLHMTDDMLGPSPMHIKYMYSSYVYDGFCI